MGALLHDIARMDVPLMAKDHATPSARKAEKFLKSLKLDKEMIEHVIDAVRCHSEEKINSAKTKEALAVFDADKLDAIGPRGMIRNIGWFARYKHLDWEINKLFDKSLAAGSRRVKIIRTKTGKILAKKYLSQTKEFVKGYNQIRNKIK
jgi:HD superfamily phosphodiesterase